MLNSVGLINLKNRNIFLSLKLLFNDNLVLLLLG